MTGKKKDFKYVSIIILAIVLMFLGFCFEFFIIYSTTYTYKISKDTYTNQQEQLESIPSADLEKTRHLCNKAITAYGQIIVDDYVLVSTDDESTTFFYFWKNSKGDYYRAEAQGDYYVATNIILEQNNVDSLVSVDFDGYALTVKTTHNAT